jgi:hypothetical protein
MKTEQEKPNVDYTEADFLDHQIEAKQMEIDELTIALGKAKRDLKFLEKKQAQLALKDPQPTTQAPAPCPCEANSKKIDQFELQLTDQAKAIKEMENHASTMHGLILISSRAIQDAVDKITPPASRIKIPRWILNLWNLVRDILRGGK